MFGAGEVSTDSESDADGPPNVDMDGNFECPDGYVVVDAPPTDFFVENLKAHGLMVALKRPYGKDLFGSEIGNFLQICPERKKGRLQKHRGCYEILFEDDVEYFWPKRPTSDYGCERWWVLIKEVPA